MFLLCSIKGQTGRNSFYECGLNDFNSEVNVNVRIYVGNLPFKTTDAELRTLFEGYGEVESADVIRYKGSGRSKGYAFVVMDEEASEKAVAELNENEYEGRALKVRVAKPRENFPRDGSKESGSMKSMHIGID